MLYLCKIVEFKIYLFSFFCIIKEILRNISILIYYFYNTRYMSHMEYLFIINIVDEIEAYLKG